MKIQQGYYLEIVQKMKTFLHEENTYNNREWKVIKKFAWLPVHIFISIHYEYNIWLKTYYDFYVFNEEHGWVPFVALEPKHLC